MENSMKVSFYGKLKGAIGSGQYFLTCVGAANLDEARAKLYEEYEHILFLKEEDNE